MNKIIKYTAFISMWLLISLEASACLVEGSDPLLCETKEIQFETNKEAELVVTGKAVELAGPVKIYEYLRNNTTYKAYHGSHSNSLNTILSMRGNDVDLATAFIATLRAAGIKSRFVEGNIKLKREELANWMGVSNSDLAIFILANQGIQNIDKSNPDYVTFQHTWVEALVNYENYRARNNASSDQCVSEVNGCHWVALDVSFKQKKYKKIYQTLLRDLSFNYNGLYNAEKPANASQNKKDKNPLEIFEEQALAYLRNNHPGVTLEDVIDSGEIITDNSGVLPASLPYEVVGAVSRYNSIQDHDAASNIKWTKYIQSFVVLGGCKTVPLLPDNIVSLADLSTKKLTLNVQVINGISVLLHRLDGERRGDSYFTDQSASIACDTGKVSVDGESTFQITNGTAMKARLFIDAVPGTEPIYVEYQDLVVGGYYLIATGDESSNWSQVERAYKQLLGYNSQIKIVTDPEGVAYVDVNNNGYDAADIALIDSNEPQDLLIGGLLHVAQRIYYARLRDESERYSRLKGMVSPIMAYIGIVSTHQEVQYLDDLPFAVMPKGLLIDLKGLRTLGSYEIDKAPTRSNDTFKFIGHIASSLEHEIWQEITGFDAISTVRGIQKAIADGAQLVEFDSNDTAGISTVLAKFNFKTSAPGFTLTEYEVFGRKITTWKHNSGATNEGFYIFRPNTEGLPDTAFDNQPIAYTATNGVEPFIGDYSRLEAILNKAIETGKQPNFMTVNYDIQLPPTGVGIGIEVEAVGENDSLQYKGFTVSGVTYPFSSGPGSLTITAPTVIDLGPYGGALNGGPLPDQNYLLSIRFKYSYETIISSRYCVTIPQACVPAVAGLPRYCIPGYTHCFPAVYGIAVGTIARTTKMPISDTLVWTCPADNQAITALPASMKTFVKNCFIKTIEQNNVGEFIDFLDVNKGFNASNYLYRVREPGFDEVHIGQLKLIRDDMFNLDAGIRNRYFIPNKYSHGENFLFNVFLKEKYNGLSLTRSTFAIANYSELLNAGGGYVTASDIIPPSYSFSDYSNDLFTDYSFTSSINNDWLTPSTWDPVSTVTGNMYHDETDFVIKGRGLDYTFSRTYNSLDIDEADNFPLSKGWTHSYNMKLIANDHGQFPNYSLSEAPENNNNKTSSITYVNERGGEVNYLVDDVNSTWSIKPPKLNFDSLELNMPSNGLHTLTFRNGTKYVFEGGDLKVPGNSARLAYIEDVYGKRLSMGYTGDKLTSIKDNLAIAERTGLVLTYYPPGDPAEGRLKQISDWVGRTWVYAYNATAQLHSVTNPLDNSMRYSYHEGTDKLKLIISPETRGGNGVKATLFGYYEDDRAYNYIDQLGNEESLTYDLFRKRTRITNPRDFVTEHYYDKNGGLIKLVEPDEGILQFENTVDGLRYLKRDALGYATKYSYNTLRTLDDSSSDTLGLVTREQDALGRTKDYDYGIYNQLTSVKDKNNVSIVNEYYDATDVASGAVKGKLHRVVMPSVKVNGVLQTDVIVSEYQYHADASIKRIEEMIDPATPLRKRVTDFTYIYLPTGVVMVTKKVTGATSGGSVTTQQIFDSLFRLRSETVKRRTSATDATMLALTIRYEYDDLNRPIKVTDTLGNITETIYDKNNKISQVIKRYALSGENDRALHDKCTVDVEYPNHHSCVEIINDYDKVDRLISTTNINGTKISYEYDGVNNVTKVTNAMGQSIVNEYDAKNRLTKITNENGYSSETKYDLTGRVTSSVDANGNTTTFSYDKLGRKKSITSPEGRVTHFDKYDGNGNLIKIRDANAVADRQPVNLQGASLFKQYDQFNRVVTEVNANKEITRYAYDLLGNVTSVTDALYHVTKFAYDDLGRLTQISDPIIESSSDKVRRFTYDEVGNRLTAIDRKGDIVRNTYDKANRLILNEYLTDKTTQTIVYNQYGELAEIANNDVTYNYVYDNQHRMISKIDSRTGKSLSWAYNIIGNVKSKTDYQGDITSYTYDDTNRLVAMSNSAYLQVSYHYDAAGRLLSRILSNGVTTLYAYDHDGFLTKVTQRNANGMVIDERAYIYDDIGNITDVVASDGEKISYAYDPAYRLITVDSNNNAHDQSYTYDKVGNRKSMTQNGTSYYFIYNNKGNRLDEIRTGSALLHGYDYDDNGSRIAKRNGSGVVTEQYFYNQERLIAQQIVNSKTLDFSYDPNAYRIQKINASGTSNYLLEGENLEATYDENNQIKASYFRGVVVDEIINGFEKNSDGKLINQSYYHDQINSVVAVTDHNSVAKQTKSYSPFGLSLESTGTSNNTLAYTGRELDIDSGLYYYRARYYDPFAGRFLSEDPLGFHAGINFYAYVGNNPINYNDPSGNCPTCLVGAGTSVVLGGAIRFFTGGDVFDAGAMATDALLGAAGAGIVSKATQLYQMRHIAAPFSTKLAAGSGVNAQAEIKSGIYFFERGGSSYVGQSYQTGTRLSAHVANPAKPILNANNAVRASVSGGKASREVAEQFALNSMMGGTNASGVLNVVNPIGSARQGLLTQSGFGIVDSIATPAQSFLNPVVSGLTTGGFNLFGSSDSSAAGDFVSYPSNINNNTSLSVYQK